MNLDSVKKFASLKNPEDFARSMRLREACFMSRYEMPSQETLKELIMNHGAIVITFWHKLGKFHNNTYFNNNARTTNHDALLIGWDDDFSRDNFASPKPSRNGAWLVKNSFGPSTGYFWMSYEQYIVGGTAFIVEKNNSRLSHYGYDDLGSCSALKYSWAANTFKIRTKRERLKEAAFYTTHHDTDFELFVYSHGKSFPDSPVSGELIANTSGRLKYAGYHTVDLQDSIYLDEGDYFSVVLKLSNGLMSVETRVKNYSDNAVVNAKESCFSHDGLNWIDGVKLDSNACIKAFTLTR